MKYLFNRKRSFWQFSRKCCVYIIRTLPSARGLIYKSSVDCLIKTVENEGIFGLYKGFIPVWIRMAPWSLTFWLSFEQIRHTIGATAFWRALCNVSGYREGRHKCSNSYLQTSNFYFYVPIVLIAIEFLRYIQLWN